MMIERLLYTTIQEGIAYLKANPQTIIDFFGEDGLLDSIDKVTEPTKISSFFTTNPPSVIHGFMRPETKFPAYCITLASDSTSQQFLGDEGGFIGAEDPANEGRFIDTEVRAYNYVLLIAHQHPDVVLYLYHLLMWIITVGKKKLINAGLMDIKMSGADLLPDQRTMPTGLFVRRLTFSCEYEWAIAPPPDGPVVSAFKIGGIHWDTPESAGAPGADTGGVIGNVTTSLDGEEDNDDVEDEEGYLGG